METVMVLLLADLIVSTFCYETCPEAFYPSMGSSRKSNAFGRTDPSSVPRWLDESSGCTCKQPSNHTTVCFSPSCDRFPKDANITTSTLKVKGTQISRLEARDLSSVTHLTVLVLDSNFNLTFIAPGSFRNMTLLTNLSISSNANLRSLESGTFDGLVNLKGLNLTKDAFTDLEAVTPALANLPSLLVLNLKENHFVDLKRESFEVMRGSSVEELDLSLCQIEHMHPETFDPLTHLKVLSLTENTFNVPTLVAVIKEITNRLPLKVLNLNSIGLTKTPPNVLLSAIARTNITDLSLAGNRFEVFNSESFPHMPNLRRLDLSHVSALNITKDAFVTLPNLEILILGMNKLTLIPEELFAPNLTYLDLGHNSGDSSSPSDFSLPGGQFKLLKALKCLRLAFNTVNALQNSSFQGLTSLEVLDLNTTTLYRISGGTFAAVPNLLVLNLENNLFVQNHLSEWSEGMFADLTKLQVLLLAGCGVTFLNHRILQGLGSLKYLGLERNKLLTPQGVETLKNLKALDLSQNNLQPWSDPAFLNNHELIELQLDDNKLAYLTTAMIEDFNNLSSLELMDNPFVCDCRLSWTDVKVMTLLDDQPVFCAFPEATTNLTIVEFLVQEHHCQNWNLVVALVAVFVVLVVIFSLIFYFRWHLRYWLFLTRLYLSRRQRRRNKKVKQAEDNYMYDAFVSYSSEDRSFVIRLVSMLENYPPFIRLCVYERDFEVGTMISENVLESVAKSRKTLLIISDSYAKSHWCRWESQIADNHRLFFENERGEYVDDGLILIKLGPVNAAHLTPTLKYLLKTRIYLQWDAQESKQKVFWEKLRGTLAPPTEGKEITYL